MSDFGTPVGDSNVTYYSIGGGNIVLPAEANEPGAKLRTWERPDGTEGSKWEFRFKDFTGMITGLEFKDSQYGENLYITLVNSSGKKAKLQISVDSDYFRSFATMLKNIDLEDDVTFNAYDFEGDDGKRKRGLSITQDGQKIQGYYYDFDKKESKNGMPAVSKEDAKTYEKDDWKMYFMGVKKFLKNEVKGVVIPNYSEPEEDTSTPWDNDKEISVEDVTDLFKEDNGK